MKLGNNIARNIALRENVFMITVCVELRIPLFLVGKPGSSKSLAKSIVADSMHGKSSESQLLKMFKEVRLSREVLFIHSLCFSLLHAGTHVLLPMQSEVYPRECD